MTPPTGYLSTNAINVIMQFLTGAFPSFTEFITLPETSVNKRSIHAMRIGAGSEPKNRGILFLGGMHARELINPDMLLTFAYKMCWAYSNNLSITLGGQSYSANQIKTIVENEDIFIVPLVNPDGRDYVLDPNGDRWWRKNRSVNSGSPCMGVDLNRNFDFLFDSGIGTSSSPCSEVYRGPYAFSEPETRNVRYMLDCYPQITAMVDVHSYSQLLMYPWGDDQDQTTDPSMNFTNPAFDGQRGILNDRYKEFITAGDLNFASSVSNSVRDAISAVSGTVYTVEQSIGLYPTTGTSDDYSMSRHYANANQEHVFGFAVETGTEFQPENPATIQKIIDETTSGMIEYCLLSICLVEQAVKGIEKEISLDDLRAFRDREMLRTPTGRRYARLLVENTPELLGIIADHPEIRKEGAELIHHAGAIIRSRKDRQPKVVEHQLVESAERLALRVAKLGSPRLKKAIEELREDARFFDGCTVTEGLRLASRRREKVS